MKIEKMKGNFKQKPNKMKNQIKTRMDLKEKTEAENKVRSVFQNYNISENNLDEREISDY